MPDAVWLDSATRHTGSVTNEHPADVSASSATSKLARRVLITRPLAQVRELCDALEGIGAVPVVLPLLTIEPNSAAAESPLWADVPTYDWIVFTSANGVRYAWEHAADALQHHPRIAVVGPATAAAVTARGGSVCVMAPVYVAESLADALGDVVGARILWPRGKEARSVLGQTWRARGAWVDECVVYATRPAPLPSDAAALVHTVDIATFASPSAVRRFVESFGVDTKARVLCIGPVTAAAARQHGLRVDAVAESYTAAGLVRALEKLNV